MADPATLDKVPVRVLTVCCTGGVPEQVLTLYEGETFDVTAAGDLDVALEHERVVIRGPAIVWYSVRQDHMPPKAALQEAIRREIARQRASQP